MRYQDTAASKAAVDLAAYFDLDGFHFDDATQTGSMALVHRDDPRGWTDRSARAIGRLEIALGAGGSVENVQIRMSTAREREDDDAGTDLVEAGMEVVQWIGAKFREQCEERECA